MQRTQSAIHTAGKDEYPQLIQVWEGAVRATHDFLPDAYIVRLKNLLLTHYLATVTVFCTRDEQMNITGFASAKQDRLEMLFIDQQSRDTGIGSALLAAAIAANPALLVDVNEQNPQAVGFYHRHGFVTVGRQDTDADGRPFPMLNLAYLPPAS